MRASVSGLVAYGFSAVLAYLTVVGGQTIVQTQLSDPLLSGIFWAVSVGGVLLGVLIGAIVLLAMLLEILERIGPPELLGRTTYRLVGSAGLLGASIATVRIVSAWSTGHGWSVTPESITALLLVAGPVAYASYRLWRLQRRPTAGTTATDGTRHEPETVRDKTAQWADDQTRRQASPERANRGLSPTEVRRQSQTNNKSDQRAHFELGDLSFDWTTHTGIDFEDVGGMEEVKAELQRDVIKPLTSKRAKAKELGIAPTNILFHGPPGTGKTYMAKALATELGLPFVKLSGADIQSKWINESSQKVRTLFEEAEAVAEEAGGAVIFLDELDSVLKNRGAGRSHEEDTKVVNEFLNRLENTGEHNILFIGATNRLESLDEAGIRSGRVDKKIHIGLPDCDARMSILKTQLADRPHCLTDDQIRVIAERTDGMSAADLASLVEDAARHSLFQRNDTTISQNDMYQALVD